MSHPDRLKLCTQLSTWSLWGESPWRLCLTIGEANSAVPVCDLPLPSMSAKMWPPSLYRQGEGRMARLESLGKAGYYRTGNELIPTNLQRSLRSPRSRMCASAQRSTGTPTRYGAWPCSAASSTRSRLSRRSQAGHTGSHQKPTSTWSGMLNCPRIGRWSHQLRSHWLPLETMPMSEPHSLSGVLANFIRVVV